MSAFTKSMELIQNYPRNYYLQSMSGPMNGTRRSSVAWDPNSWKEECLNLTQDLLDAEDSVPFRQPVDPIEVPVSYSSKCCSLLFSHGLMLIPDIETFFLKCRIIWKLLKHQWI